MTDTPKQPEEPPMPEAAPAIRAPDAPWEPQAFRTVELREEAAGPTFGSVPAAIRWAMHSDGGAKAQNPAAVHGLGRGFEDAMIARGWVLKALDAVPVGCRIPLVLYAHRESIDHVARALHRRRETVEAWVREGERLMVAELEPRGILGR